jgi:tetratricopeptide (TPR) repeat protein
MKFRTSFVFALIVISMQTVSALASMADIERAIVMRQYEKVQMLSEQALQLNNLDRDMRLRIMYYLALSQIHRHDYKDARDVFQQVIDAAPDNQIYDQAYLGLFDAYYRDEYYEPAKLTIERMFRLRPESAFLSIMHLKAARVNLKLANWTQAKGHLMTIRSDFPNSFEADTARQLLEEKHYFSVQIGAFLERERAQSLVNELQNKDEYAYIIETRDRHDRRFFRVRVGQLTRIKEAQRLKNKLSRHGYPTQIVP